MLKQIRCPKKISRTSRPAVLVNIFAFLLPPASNHRKTLSGNANYSSFRYGGLSRRILLPQNKHAILFKDRVRFLGVFPTPLNLREHSSNQWPYHSNSPMSCPACIPVRIGSCGRGSAAGHHRRCIHTPGMTCTKHLSITRQFRQMYHGGAHTRQKHRMP